MGLGEGQSDQTQKGQGHGAAASEGPTLRVLLGPEPGLSALKLGAQ